MTSAQTLAEAVAHEVDAILNLNAASVLALASQPGMASFDPAVARVDPQGFAKAYPGTTFFSSYDRDGRPIARSDGRPPISAAGLELFERARDDE